MKFKPWMIFAVLAGFVLIGATAFLGGRLLAPHEFHGAVLQSPQPAQNFSLMSHVGQRVALNDFRGKIVLLYFGYTICPDVCPTTLAELSKARKMLGKDADQIQVLMVTVDPERDTLPVLADYMTHFHPSFLGLAGTPDEIAQAATPFGVFYEKENSDSALGYLVNHTATVMIVDRNGYLRIVFPFGTTADDIAADLKYLIQK
jgi:protein SCO1/2